MHQATCVTGIRRARYIGLGKTRLEHLAAATFSASTSRRRHESELGSRISIASKVLIIGSFRGAT